MSCRFVGQTLHEELLYANYVNPFRPGDAMTSVTYVQRVEQHPNGELPSRDKTRIEWDY